MATHTLDFERPLLELERQIDEMKRTAGDTAVDVSKELAALERKLAELRREIYRNLTPMQRVQVARHPKRPYTLDYVNTVFTDFVELHGDRLFRDDPAIVGGWARLDGMSVMVIGHQKGRDTKENLHRNFGMAHPEGYRKALRLMALAEKFGAPVITPEGCAAILWKDATQRERAAEALKITADDLLELGVIDEIIPEPAGGAHADPESAAEALGDALRRHARLLRKTKIEKLLKRREEKYLSMGALSEK